MKLFIALVGLGLGLGLVFIETATASPQTEAVAVVADFDLNQEGHQESASTLPCASGGPVSEAFYESMYLRCLQTYCPSKCTAGGRAKGDYYTNGHYNIVCVCY